MKMDLTETIKRAAREAIDEYTYCGKTLKQMADTYRWRNVDDELPEPEERVLVYAVGRKEPFIGESTIAITEYTNNLGGLNISKWNSPWSHFLSNYKITHWQPLPMSPEEE